MMALFDAATTGDPAAVPALLEDASVKLNRRDSDGRTALHHAAAAGHAAFVQSLVERGAKVDTQDNDGQGMSPLHSAAAAGRTEVVAVLVSAGANLELAANSARSTPLILAASKGHVDCVHTLLAASARVLATDASGATALHRAASRGHMAAMQTLLSSQPAGTIINACDSEGHTPFHLAAIHEQEHACVALAEAGADLETTNARGEAPAALLKLSVRSQLGLSGEGGVDAEDEDATDWLSENFPVPAPKPPKLWAGVGVRV
jgi:ankyrin repeat protein